jgi:hypothetical protein
MMKWLLLISATTLLALSATQASTENSTAPCSAPEGESRTTGAPLVTGLEQLPDAQVITRIIHVKTMPAAQLVPILRPLVPAFGHLAASVCTNDLLLVDRFANAKRIEAIVKELDKNGETYKVEKCSPESK